MVIKYGIHMYDRSTVIFFLLHDSNSHSGVLIIHTMLQERNESLVCEYQMYFYSLPLIRKNTISNTYIIQTKN